MLAELGFALLGWIWLAWLFGDAVMNPVVNLLVWTTGLVGGLGVIVAVVGGIVGRRRACGIGQPQRSSAGCTLYQGSVRNRTVTNTANSL